MGCLEFRLQNVRLIIENRREVRETNFDLYAVFSTSIQNKENSTYLWLNLRYLNISMLVVICRHSLALLSNDSVGSYHSLSSH